MNDFINQLKLELKILCATKNKILIPNLNLKIMLHQVHYFGQQWNYSG